MPPAAVVLPDDDPYVRLTALPRVNSIDLDPA
jgi:hypothetical protein